MRELHWEKMGTEYSESSWLLFPFRKDVDLKKIVDTHNTKFEMLMPVAYTPDAQSPRSTMEKIAVRKGESDDDASAGRKRIREAWAGTSYHLGSHEYLRLLGYDSDDDINMCLASKPLVSSRALRRR